jgi:hypothetical protein
MNARGLVSWFLFVIASRKGVTPMSSRSSSNRVLVRPFVEEGGSGWAEGLMRCAAVCRFSAEKMKAGIWPGNWQREIGAAKLLEKIARPMKGKKVVEGEGVPKRVSDGRKSKVPRMTIGSRISRV